MAAQSRELDPAQNQEPQTPIEDPLSRVFQTRLSRRGLGRLAVGAVGAALGAGAVGDVTLLHPNEAEAKADNGLIGTFPSVEPTPQATEAMNRNFEETAKETLDNINNFKKWIEEVNEETGERGADEFHRTFAELRSELQDASALGLTPPELATSVRDTVNNRGPMSLPADFSGGQEPKAGRFFGKVAYGKISDGQKDDENLLIGGEADVVLFGVTFHDFTSRTGAKGKVVLIHFGGVNESKAWNASGFWNVVWPDGEYVSKASQFRVETDASNTQREWPYNPPPGEPYPPPEGGQAGINQIVEWVGKGMASISIGSTQNYDWLMQWAKDYEAQHNIDPFGGLAPDFIDKDFYFNTSTAGQHLLRKLELHAVGAMMDEAKISGREMGITQFGFEDGSRKDYIGTKAMKKLFPKATEDTDWVDVNPTIKPTDYFLGKPELTIEDIYMLPNISAKRFAYPEQFPQGAGIINPAY